MHSARLLALAGQPGTQCAAHDCHKACRCHIALVQVLSSLELARKARMAANRAFLASLAGDSSPAAEGAAPAAAVQLAPDHALVLSAARRLANAAVAQEARTQVLQCLERSSQLPGVGNLSCHACSCGSRRPLHVPPVPAPPVHHSCDSRALIVMYLTPMVCKCAGGACRAAVEQERAAQGPDQGPAGGHPARSGC